MTKTLSIHRPTKKIYSSYFLFSHYLAGLIDGDGHISKIGQIIICFNEKDLENAYFIKNQIGYGKIRKIKNKKAYNYIVSNSKGISYISSLIKDKIKDPNKIDQFNNRLYPKYISFKTLNDSTINWNTPWFSGFCESNGYFRIYILNKEIRLLCQIDQKTNILLKQVQNNFGGYIGYRKDQDTYYYSSVSYKNIFKIIKYFDQYSLQSKRYYLKYFFLRKSLILIQNKEHLKDEGFLKIKKYKVKMENMK